MVLHTDAVTRTACREEHPQVCSQIRLAPVEVRRRTPSPGLRGTQEGEAKAHCMWDQRSRSSYALHPCP